MEPSDSLEATCVISVLKDNDMIDMDNETDGARNSKKTLRFPSASRNVTRA